MSNANTYSKGGKKNKILVPQCWLPWKSTSGCAWRVARRRSWGRFGERRRIIGDNVGFGDCIRLVGVDNLPRRKNLLCKWRGRYAGGGAGDGGEEMEGRCTRGKRWLVAAFGELHRRRAVFCLRSLARAETVAGGERRSGRPTWLTRQRHAHYRGRSPGSTLKNRISPHRLRAIVVVVRLVRGWQPGPMGATDSSRSCSSPPPHFAPIGPLHPTSVI